MFLFSILCLFFFSEMNNVRKKISLKRTREILHCSTVYGICVSCSLSAAFRALSSAFLCLPKRISRLILIFYCAEGRGFLIHSCLPLQASISTQTRGPHPTMLFSPMRSTLLENPTNFCHGDKVRNENFYHMSSCVCYF